MLINIGRFPCLAYTVMFLQSLFPSDPFRNLNIEVDIIVYSLDNHVTF
jgi:hypothetical protein